MCCVEFLNGYDKENDLVWVLLFLYCLMHGTIAVANILTSTPCIVRVLVVFTLGGSIHCGSRNWFHGPPDMPCMDP